MPLHPVFQHLIQLAQSAGRPAIADCTPPQLRASLDGSRAALGPGPAVGSVTEMHVPTRSGSVPARLYRPTDRAKGLIVYFHGGGWVCGSLDYYDGLARELVHHSSCALLLVDYRLAPEHRFPAGLDDAEDAIAWSFAARERLAGDAVPFVVGGDSAGGNLAIVALAALRQRVSCALQFLLYPVTDADFERDSYRLCSDGMPLTRADMRWFFEHYAPPGLWLTPRISPVRADDLSGMPPTWIATAEYDVLRDEGEDYARRLAEAGVMVQLHRAAGMTHGFAHFANLVPPVSELLQQLGQHVTSQCEDASLPAPDSLPTQEPRNDARNT
ncbi:Carboxylesterase NlhH [Pandoraea terrae]|uniref:Carboxylesterase NlhH n=1 Tax=Pandoraea terrae TaxID=1537710 RepID=A0A5E4U9A1_9BURK|nr:alpha/beta hydrolase [Pandoraea terrae]VVD95598.1 Carboxylesterase NlhH [Pandoraea terrae]